MFVCYAHKDSNSVYADLLRLDSEDIKLWYDEGIEAGKSWRGEIAASIKDATKFIFYISKASLQSAHCLREVDYALSNNVDIIPVYLDDSILPGELELVFNRVQALFRNTDPMYMEHLLGALQGVGALVPLDQLGKNKKLRIGLPVLLLGCSLLVLGFWSQRNSIFDDEQSSPNTIAAPNAFDRYLEGLDLMERWDLDDNLDVAIVLFRDAISLDPEFALGFARLADSLRMLAALGGDETYLDEAGDYADVAVRLNPGLSPVQVALGKVHTSRGNIDLAHAALERALSIDPNDANANQAMGIVYEQQGKLTEAEASIQKGVALDSENTLILDLYANFLYRQSRYEEAASQWQAVIRLAPEHYGALVNLGAALGKIGRNSEEIFMYERAIEIRPTYMAYSNLGTAYGRVERYRDAVNALLNALEIDASDWLAWGNLAYVYYWINGMDAQAVETFEYAIQLAEIARLQSPRDPFVHSDLALYYAMMENSELALQRLNTALILSPDSSEIQFAGAEAYESLGQRDKAVEQIKKSLELGYPRQLLLLNPEIVELLRDPRLEGI